MLRGNVFPWWMGCLGIASGGLGWVAMWCNLTALVGPAARLDNVVSPEWVIVFRDRSAPVFRLRHPRVQGTGTSTAQELI